MLSYFNSGWRNETVDILKRPNWEFYFVVDGSAAPIFETGKQMKQRSNTLWVFPPNMDYGYQGGKFGFFRYVFHYVRVPEVIENEVNKKGFLRIDLTKDEIETFKESFIKAEELYLNPQNTSSLYHEKLLLDICIFIVNKLNIDSESNLKSRNRTRVDGIITWYSLHIKKRYTIEKIASENNISTVHMYRLFKECFNKSPNEYFTEFKIERAKYLMNKSDATLHEIARESGFLNDSDLCRTFKKLEKITPTRFRKI